MRQHLAQRGHSLLERRVQEWVIGHLDDMGTALSAIAEILTIAV